MLVKDISCDCECKFNGSACYPNQNGIMINDNVNVKSVASVKRVIVGILVYALVRIVGIQKVLLRFQ